MAEPSRGPEVNLEELRNQLLRRLARSLIVASILLIWLRLLVWVVRPRYFPVIQFSLLAVLLGLGLVVLVKANVRPILARHLLLWGLTAELLVAMWLLPDPWLPLLGLTLTFVGALLASGGGWLTAGAVSVLAAWLTHRGVRSYLLLQLLITLGFGATLAWLVAHTFYTALGWAWTMQQRADYLLGLARDRQAELSRTLKSLKNSNTILARMQHELIIARKHAEDARLMKEQFAANISHELRTPLSLILGFSEVMCLSSEVYGDMEWPAALRQDVYQIYRNSRHLLEMINDVLDLSRLEMVGFTLNKEPTLLEPLLRDTAEIVVHLFRNRTVSLEIEVEPNLPPLEIDVTRVRQVLLNLLNNAARFTKEGSVSVGAWQADGEVMISVSDTGPGIPADKLPYVFDEFYQVDLSLHRQYEGAGLGLAISKHFVEAHDGRLWVESQEGVGSTFTFTLPIPDYHAPVSRPYMTSWVDPSWASGPSPILVVDPDPEMIEMVQRHLEGYEVVQVHNGEQLAEAVSLHHPRAVVYNVPPGERARVNGSPSASVPLIECSLPSRVWAKNHLAVVGYLNKPIVAKHLLLEIERAGDIHEVLVVDDERGFCQLVERILKSSGYAFSVRQAYSGEKGLQAMRERRPDLLLLDLIMPDVDGLQVLDEMRLDPELADIPVILLTATSYVEDVMDQRGSQMIIRRPGGLRPSEALRCLGAVIDVLEPHYDEHSVPKEAVATRTA